MNFIVWFSGICWYHHKSQFGFNRSIIAILMAGNKVFLRKSNFAESSLKNRIPFYIAYEDDIFHYSINLKSIWFKSCLENALNKLSNILPGITLPTFDFAWTHYYFHQLSTRITYICNKNKSWTHNIPPLTKTITSIKMKLFLSFKD